MVDRGLYRAKLPTVGTLRRYLPSSVCTRKLGWALYAGKVLHLSAGSIRCSVVDVRTTVGLNRLGEVRVQTWMVLVHLAHIETLSSVVCVAVPCLMAFPSVRVLDVSTLRAATHQCRENHVVDDLHGRRGSLTETCFNLVWYPLHSDRTASPGRYTNTGQRATVPRAGRGGFYCSAHNV